ncbi:glycosyltransferase involved in cell wall biosynthesis [Desulfohalotomaculum tongense]|uniref:glycosyltransferase family 4 protein n=1 Tax=Desulforadius tongensis TaxID=1216062 RepID=UPI0019575B28|nr:glycosyltransferase family 4 protein [Desulforadius tongensis]MBM7853716.1 glycosyltransferase involved in cell wall biosynthesis [Desulforadius tongensis]
MKKTKYPKIKVLQLITLSETGGAQNVVLDIIRALDNNMFEIHLACRPGGQLINKLNTEFPEVKIHSIRGLNRPINPLQDMLAFYRLFKLFRREKYRIVHCHSSKAGVLGRAAAFLAGVPTVFFTVHGWSFYSASNFLIRYFYEILERILAAITDKLIFVSVNDYIVGKNKKIFHDNIKGVVIHNGVDTKKFKCCSQERASEVVEIITVGRLSVQKDPLSWLDIVEETLSAVNTPVRFTWVGDGPLRKEIEKEIEKRGLIKHIRLLGCRKDIPDLLSKADIFLLTSKWEGFPLVLLEAMAGGLPVVSYNVGGISECILDGVNGYLHDQGDAKRMVHSLSRLINNIELRHRLGNKGRELAVTKFDISHFKLSYKQLYYDSISSADFLAVR